MLVLVAKITVKSGFEQEFERTMRAAVPKVRAEAGNHAEFTKCAPVADSTAARRIGKELTSSTGTKVTGAVTHMR